MGEITPEYIEFKKKVEAQRKVIDRKRILLDAQREILLLLLIDCPHEEIEEKRSYDSGSYYDKATTQMWNRCKLCGAESQREIIQHNYYG